VDVKKDTSKTEKPTDIRRTALINIPIVFLTRRMRASYYKLTYV